MSDLLNTHLGPYRLTEVSGRGGMATVYKAYQPSLDRYVAIKVLPHVQDPLFAARFKREARALAQIQHPNILPVHDYGEQDNLLYLVLQYIENGVTLGDMLGKPMEPTRALRLVGLVLDALDYAHARGVIHRDIKPSNILMSSPTWPMLADFGIAQLLDNTQRLTLSGMIIGTVAYMAPEQALSAKVDARADLYATGVVLYEMLTGQVPFEADTPLAMLMKHAYETPPSLRTLNPSLPVALEATVLHALAKNPAARYQSASKMAAALERAAAQIEQPRVRSQVTELYQAGVQAFAEGRWDAAIERLSQLSALAPTYEDSAELLAAAQERARAAARQPIDLLRQPQQNTTESPLPVTPPLAPGALPEARHPAAITTAPAPSPADVTAPPQAHTLPRPIRPRVWFAMGGMVVLLVLILALVFIDESIGSSTPSPSRVQPAAVAVQTRTIGAQMTTIGVPAPEIMIGASTMAAVPTAGATPMTKATPTETVPPTSTPTPVPPSATSTNTNTPRPTQTPRLRPTNTPQLDTPTPPPTAQPPPLPTETPPPPTETPSALVATIVHPGPGEYEPAATTELIFQVEAYDQKKGTNDGDGIENVDMYIYDSNNVQVYHRTERSSHYCAFSGDNGGPCPALNFARCNNTWATTNCQSNKGKPIVSGDYTLQAIVKTNDGRTTTVTGKVKVQLAAP